MKHGHHMKPVHHEHHKHGSDEAKVMDHHHSMHKGPHHDHYIHPENRAPKHNMYANKGDHALGDSNHIKSLMGEPSGEDVVGHHGKMKW